MGTIIKLNKPTSETSSLKKKHSPKPANCTKSNICSERYDTCFTLTISLEKLSFYPKTLISCLRLISLHLQSKIHHNHQKKKKLMKCTNLLELIDHFRLSGKREKKVQKFNLKKPMKEMKNAWCARNITLALGGPRNDNRKTLSLIIPTSWRNTRDG